MTWLLFMILLAGFFTLGLTAQYRDQVDAARAERDEAIAALKDKDDEWSLIMFREMEQYVEAIEELQEQLDRR